MRILIVSSEAWPFAKTGGLADVAGALPRIFSHSAEVTLAVPEYATAEIEGLAAKEVASFPVAIGSALYPATIKCANLQNNLRLLLVGQELFFARKFIYGNAAGEYPDNFQRFFFFQRALVEYMIRQQERFQVILVNDWQTALIPALIANNRFEAVLRQAKTVLAIHNLGYQGLFPASYFPDLGFPASWFSSELLEFYGGVNFLKGGIVFADALVTVSPTYAREILTPALGFGLDGILRRHAEKLRGILNGVDYSQWSPEVDRFIQRRYSVRSLQRKEENKAALYRELALDFPLSWPLFIFIGRLTEQKGVKLLLEVLPALLRGEACFVALASGEEIYEERLRQLAKRFRKRMKFVQRFDEPLAHKLEAAGDLLLMPSLYEPCGLNQIYSLRYGTVPIVRATGGLADTVKSFAAETKQGTGFLFNENSAGALLAEIHRALALFPDRELWQALQKNGMRENFSWDDSAAHYLNLFQNLLAKEKSDG